ncbi:MAG: bifunctional 2-polyprenyl-6-hydroxyphenol methylase/3-demethylubiquinol 3-O-methyltransferase UbiG [Pseudomonadota bacterium]
MSDINDNINPDELRRFEAAASKWWDLEGGYAALHCINPLRVRFIDTSVAGLSGKMVLDVGCGGGVLAEAMAARGARVTGIDMGEAALSVARRHGRNNGLPVTYHRSTVEAFEDAPAGGYDAVTCMELLEHVPSPASVIGGCARLLKPGGHLVIATLNRTLRSWLLAIVMAEWVLGIVTRGTHSWRQFVRPADIAAWGASAGLRTNAVTGLRYLPYLNHAGLCRSTSVNYMMHLTLAPAPAPTATLRPVAAARTTENG